jgi:two-component system KDP operon response regulator KdpE
LAGFVPLFRGQTFVLKTDPTNRRLCRRQPSPCEEQTITIDDAPVQLTKKEFELLALLTRHAGRVVTHTQILEKLWGPAHTEAKQYLRVYVGQLREKLKDSSAKPRFIVTVPGVGYRFVE